MMRSANPALNEKIFATRDIGGADEGVMTIQGAVNKTGLMLAILVAVAVIGWSKLSSAESMAEVMPWFWLGLVGGLVLAVIITFKKTLAPVLAPGYAAVEGLLLGIISAMMEQIYPGIVVQAVFLTFGTLGSLLVAYKTGLIKVTENFKLGVAAATGGIFAVYMIGWIMSFFGSGIPYIHESGLIGIGFSLFVVVIASMNLVLDFDFIEEGARRGAPKYMEWYGAFGLIVTLVWLCIEILHLLAKLQSRR